MNEDTFCGFLVREIRILGLRAELQQIGESRKLLLLDKAGTKWEIRPITFREQDGRRVPATLSLYHRSKQGPMHYQKYSAPAHAEGVRRLLRYIRQHEQYERIGARIKRNQKQ